MIMDVYRIINEKGFENIAGTPELFIIFEYYSLLQGFADHPGAVASSIGCSF